MGYSLPEVMSPTFILCKQLAGCSKALMIPISHAIMCHLFSILLFSHVILFHSVGQTYRVSWDIISNIR